MPCSLDVSGSVNVSGTITTGNSCSLRYWIITGTTPAKGTEADYTLPTGCSYGNIVAAFGGYTNSIFFPFHNTWFITNPSDLTWSASFYIGTNGLHISVGASATSAESKPFKIIIITSA